MINMQNNYHDFWEESWKEEALAELNGYLTNYYELKNNEIDFFKENNIKNICDAACGFGAYSLAFASNGFIVSGFDISKTAVDITKGFLRKYGFPSNTIKVASITNTGYEDGQFDGVIAHAVIDHLAISDAKLALKELLRIIRSNGLLMLSFDISEKDDLEEPHVLLEDGTMQYTSGNRKGMLFHPYDWNEIEKFLTGHNIVYRTDKGNREHIVILRKE